MPGVRTPGGCPRSVVVNAGRPKRSRGRTPRVDRRRPSRSRARYTAGLWSGFDGAPNGPEGRALGERDERPASVVTPLYPNLRAEDERAGAPAPADAAAPEEPRLE